MSTRIRSRRRPKPAELLAAAFVASGLVGAGAWVAAVDASDAAHQSGKPVAEVPKQAIDAAKRAAAVESEHAAQVTKHAGETPATTATAAATPAAARSSAAKRAKVQPTTEIEHRIQYQYNSLGRRDPFTPLIDGFVPVTEGGKAPVDIGGIKVVGIVWGADAFALVEDGRGNSLILRRGDKVMNGYVEEMRRDAMVAKLTMDGQTQSVVIPLTRKGDRANASR